MSWGQMLAAMVWLVIGLAIAAGARDLGIGALNSPGPGLFPFVIGMGIAALSLCVAATTVKAPAPSRDASGRGLSALVPVIAVLLALMFYAFALERLGFILCTLVFLTGLLIALGRKSIPVALVVGAGITAGSYVAFAKLLKITLPVGPFGF